MFQNSLQVWKTNECQEAGTTCLLYDVEAFRFRYGLVALCFKVRDSEGVL